MNRSLCALLLTLLAAPVLAAPSAVRYNFSSVGRVVKLDSTQRLRKVLDPSAVLPAGPVSGTWVELHDANGKALHRVLVHDMLGTVREAPAADQKHLVNVTKAVPSNSFTVVLPDLPAGSAVVLFASPEEGAPATELARFPVEPAAQK
jgi:hypothetical protein